MSIVDAPTQRLFTVRLLLWLRLLEQDVSLRRLFRRTWDEVVAEFDSVPLFAETGLPGHHALPAEFVRRVFERLLPSAREDGDSARFIAEVFPTSAAVERFVAQKSSVFHRLMQVFGSPREDVFPARVRQDLRQALSLLAMRVGGRGVTAALRERGSVGPVEQSPFYRLVFATDKLVGAAAPRPDSAEVRQWHEVARQCGEELEEVHLHMEHEGVSSALVYDLRSIEQTLGRMQLLVAVYGDGAESENDRNPAPTGEAVRDLTNSLLRGRLDDMRLRALARDNLTLLARKTVERTGHGGEHYIAHTREGYWAMWRAAAGGGLLTVFTAALKMRILESHLPLAIEGFLIGTDYAVSFLLLQIFGFALATKQPSMTAATLAGIIRRNRGVARWSKISEFAADISRTQLAAAISNVLAVCTGAVLFEKVWAHLFKIHYLPAESAKHVYQTLHPFTSGTAIFAAFTGVLLWLAAVIGGWFENFTVYHRIPDAITQHPLGTRFGPRAMRRAAAWLEYKHRSRLSARLFSGGRAILRHSVGCPARDAEHRHPGARGRTIRYELL